MKRKGNALKGEQAKFNEDFEEMEDTDEELTLLGSNFDMELDRDRQELEGAKVDLTR